MRAAASVSTSPWGLSCEARAVDPRRGRAVPAASAGSGHRPDPRQRDRQPLGAGSRAGAERRGIPRPSRRTLERSQRAVGQRRYAPAAGQARAGLVAILPAAPHPLPGQAARRTGRAGPAEYPGGGIVRADQPAGTAAAAVAAGRGGLAGQLPPRRQRTAQGPAGHRALGWRWPAHRFAVAGAGRSFPQSHRHAETAGQLAARSARATEAAGARRQAVDHRSADQRRTARPSAVDRRQQRLSERPPAG
ncbi:hypothetical protein D9M71_221290 [compost metagenome]